jgi:LysM repeat protein
VLSSTGTGQRQTAPHPRRPGPGPQSGLLSGVDWQLVAGIALLVTAFLVALGAVVIYPRVWVLNGVRSLGVDLGGKTRAQAVLALRGHWQARTLTLSDGQTAWSVRPIALGLTLDAEATVEAAFAEGRSLEKLGARLWRGHVLDVSPVLRFDSAAARAGLQAFRPTIDVAAVNTSLRMVDGRVEATVPQAGRSFELAQTLAWLEQHPLEVVYAGRLDLVVHPVPPLAVDVSAAVAQANEWLARTVSISAYDPISDEALTWTIAPDEWGAWVSMNVDAVDPTRVDWTFDGQAAAAAVATWEASLGGGRLVDSEKALAAVESVVMDGVQPTRLGVHHSPGQHTVGPGETLSSIARDVGIPYPWIQEANPGVGDSLYVGQVLAIPSPDVLLPLPVVENKRIVISLSQQWMWAYQDGALLWEWPVSTGIPSSPTAPGVFQVQSHDPNAYAASWDLWMPHFIGIYRPVPTSDFMNGFHGFPTRDGANLLWTGDLGHPVTFGCILLGNESAPRLYQWAEEGVVVEIQQ